MAQHEHSVYDTDPHYKIDAHTRVITDQSETPTKLMQHDHNSERFTFELDRFIDGHDMTLCNKVEVHYINVDGSTKESNDGVYKVEDIGISPAGEDVVIFSWLVSKKATKYAGTLNFRLRFACVDENAKVVYAWHTEIFKGIAVSNGIDNAETVHEEYSDILEAWKTEILEELTDEINEELSTKQDKLPENIGSSSHRMWVVTPQKVFFEKDGVSYSGFEINQTKYDELIADDDTKDSVVDYNGKYYFIKPQYLKRLNTLNGNQGVITFSNYKQKAKELGKTEEWALGQVVSHGEPHDMSIAVRLSSGQLVVEAGTQPYHAVNNKKLDERLETEAEKVSGEFERVSEEMSDMLSKLWNCKKTDNLIADKGRWYTIAESHYRHYPESFLRILVSSTPNQHVTQIVCNVSALEYDANSSSIGIITLDNRHRGNAITKMRIVANTYGIDNAHGEEEGALPLELQIYIPCLTNDSGFLPFYIRVEDMGRGELYAWNVVEPKVSDELIETQQVACLVDDLSKVTTLSNIDAKIGDIETILNRINEGGIE